VSEKQRRHLHAGLAIFFAVQIPIAIGAQVLYPNLFESVWKQYLIFLSLYAIVATHWASREADTDD
jgi:hypothetical protein